MRYSYASLALAALATANPVPAGVSSAIKPSSSPPAGCSPDYSGTFQISIVKGSKRGLESRKNDPLVISLKGGVLTDSQGRTGYVASNSQFQFDSPPQAGAIYTAGFSICANGYLAIGADTQWYQCLSGTFYNLYDDNVLSAGQCSPVYIKAVGGAPAPAPSAPAPASSAPVSSKPASAPASITATASGIASAIPDGQVTGSAVSQISDGQIQAPSVTQISDGQVQAPSAPVTQISDGQIQAPTSAPAPVCSVYVDGQPQCSSAVSVSPCSVYKDGQPQCAGSTGIIPSYGANSSIAYPTPSASVVPATGAGSSVGISSQLFAIVAGGLAIALL